MKTTIQLHQQSSMIAFKSADKKQTLVILTANPSGHTIYTLFDQQILADAYIRAINQSETNYKID